MSNSILENPTGVSEDGQNGFETVVKENGTVFSYNEANDDKDTVFNGYETVLRRGNSHVDVEQSFDQLPVVFEQSSQSVVASDVPSERSTSDVEQVFSSPRDQERKSRQRPLVLICICCLLIILCVILALLLTGVFGRDGNETEDANSRETSNRPVLPTAAPSVDATLTLPEETLAAIENDPDGPQAKAMEWFQKDLEEQNKLQNSSAYTSERMRQRYALATLYFAAEGDTWTQHTGWLTSDHECNWYSSAAEQPRYIEQGVTPCRSNSESISNLVLVNNNLTTDRIPEELYLMTDLRQFDMQMNHIKGPLSPSIQNMTKLARLRLGRNQMTGEIPSVIGELSQLQVLSLYTNKFNGPIPTTLGQAQELVQLWLSGNGLTGTLPTEMGQLSELQVAWLDQNDISGEVPSELGFLPKLQDIMLHENNLVGTLPTEFGMLGNYLVNLDLRSNRLTGSVPSEIGMMSRLNTLVLVR